MQTVKQIVHDIADHRTDRASWNAHGAIAEEKITSQQKMDTRYLNHES